MAAGTPTKPTRFGPARLKGHRPTPLFQGTPRLGQAYARDLAAPAFPSPNPTPSRCPRVPKAPQASSSDANSPRGLGLGAPRPHAPSKLSLGQPRPLRHPPPGRSRKSRSGPAGLHPTPGANPKRRRLRSGRARADGLYVGLAHPWRVRGHSTLALTTLKGSAADAFPAHHAAGDVDKAGRAGLYGKAPPALFEVRHVSLGPLRKPLPTFIASRFGVKA